MNGVAQGGTIMTIRERAHTLPGDSLTQTTENHRMDISPNRRMASSIPTTADHQPTAPTGERTRGTEWMPLIGHE